MYITSDEEISGLENNIWVYNNGRVWLWQNTMTLVSNNKPRKIILTTDQDLIKDGVQSIDDEFLEWFVKNPSCERIEVEKFAINCSCENQTEAGFGDNKIYENSTCHERNRCDIEYKIIIPKEEPKFEDSIKNSLSIMSIANDMFGKKEEPKQENTAEYIDRHIVEAMVEVAKQKLYSEEDMKQAYNASQEGWIGFDFWFEQFKKNKI
jgi:hypothetical protein